MGLGLKKLLRIDTDEKERKPIPENPTVDMIDKGMEDGKFLVYFCKLVSTPEGELDKLEHFVNIGSGFKEDDIPLACDNMRTASGNVLKQRKEQENDKV